MPSQELPPAPPAPSAPQRRFSITLGLSEKPDDNNNPSPTTSSVQREPNGELIDAKKDAAETGTVAASGVLLSQNQNPEPEWAHGFQLFAILVALTFVCFLMLLDGTIIVAAVPRITDDFNSLDDIGWYGAAYQLGRYVNREFEL